MSLKNNVFLAPGLCSVSIPKISHNMLQYKKATYSDIPLLQELAHEIWRKCYACLLSPEQISYMLDLMYSFETIEKELKEGIIWEIVELNDKAIGFIAVTIADKRAKLNKLYLKEVAQGKGFGQACLKHVFEISRSHKVGDLYLHVNKSNVTAVKAYEKAGFERIDSNIFDIGNGYFMDDYIYSYHFNKERNE